MINRIKQYWYSSAIFRISLGVIGGAIAGYAYYYFIGCRAGTCAITGDPLNSTAYGAMMGLILAFPGRSDKEKK